MATITGGTIYDPYYKRTTTWKPAGPVVDEHTFYTANSKDGYVCLGVVGNTAHWNRRDAGDHTSRSTHSTIVNGRTVSPKPGWVYAIDGRVPEPDKFELWFAKQLRAGKYGNVKYWNINHRHYNRKVGWSKAVYSSDAHLHISFIPGSEYDDSSILADYERYRTGKPPTSSAPKPPTPSKPIALGSRVLKTGAKGSDVGDLQDLLNRRGQKVAVDDDFGPATDRAVRAFQRSHWLIVDGMVGPNTLGALRTNLGARVLKRGLKGADVGELQRLLNKRGAKLAVDNDFGPATEAAVRSFQKARRLGVDGQAGPKTVGVLRS